MSKRLPYFQFEPAEWLAGDIMFCTLQAQGLFTTLKALYWQKDCDLLLEQAIKRLKNEDLFEELISEKIIKIKSNKIRINFLDEQWIKASNVSIKNTKNGELGGRPELLKELTAANGETIPRHPEVGDHFIYVFKRKSNGSYKIGETQDLFKRRLTIKVPTADLEIIHFVKIDPNRNLEIEKNIKQKFIKCQISGDWFNFNDYELTNLIAEMDRQKNPKKSLNNQYIEDKIKEDNIKKKEEEKKEDTPNGVVDLKNQPEQPKIDFNKLVSFFNANRGLLPEVKKLSDARKKRVLVLEKQYGKESIQVAIEKTRDSPFLQGDNKDNWIASFDWIFKPANFLKILEDNYAARQNTRSSNSSTTDIEHKQSAVNAVNAMFGVK